MWMPEVSETLHPLWFITYFIHTHTTLYNTCNTSPRILMLYCIDQIFYIYVPILNAKKSRSLIVKYYSNKMLCLSQLQNLLITSILFVLETASQVNYQILQLKLFFFPFSKTDKDHHFKIQIFTFGHIK